MVKKRARWAVRKFWGLSAILLIVIAVVVQTGRSLAPMVSENREAIARLLSEQSSLEITIDDIQARWEGLRPELAVTGFHAHDSAGIEVLRVKNAVAQIDLLKTLWDFNLRFWRVEFEGVELGLAQDNQLHWNLVGVDITEPSDSDAAEGDASPLNLLFVGRYIHFSDVQVHFTFHNGRQHDVSLTTLLLQNDGEFHRLVAGLDLPSQTDALQIIYEGHGHSGDSENFSGQGYIKLVNYSLSDTLELVSERFADNELISGSKASAKLWFGFDRQRPLSFEGSIDFLSQGHRAKHLPERISASLLGSWRGRAGWDLQLQDAQAMWSDTPSPLLNLAVKADHEQARYDIFTPELDVGFWVSKALQSSYLPAKAETILSDLAPKGILDRLQITVPTDDPVNFTLQANLRQVAVNDWKGAPQVGFLDGFIEASAFKGFVEIDSQDAFLMHFPKVYEQAFQFETAQGQVGWEVSPDDNQVFVNSGRLDLRGDLGEAHGYFFLDAPLTRDSRPAELILQIGLQDSHALAHQKLVPYVVPQSLLSWLDQSIVSGDVSSGGFLMQGYFGADASTSRSVQVALNVERAQLNYDVRWPALEQFSGFVSIDAPDVEGWIDQGQFLQTALAPSTLQVVSHPNGEGQLLKIQGQVEGAAQSGLDVLTQTPLRDSLGSGFDDWQLSGDLSAQVNLEIPLSSAQTGHRQRVSVGLNNNTLLMSNLGLEFSHLKGPLIFSNDKGLQAHGLSAQLWEQQFALEIESQVPTEPGAHGLNTQVSFDGLLDFAHLAEWSRRPEARFVQGITPVTGSVTIGGGEVPVRLQAQSSLKGAVVELPSPYGKAAQDIRSLTVDIPVGLEQTAYQFRYDDLVSVELTQSKAGAVNGSVALGVNDKVHSEYGIWLVGRASVIDGQQWWPVIERYQAITREMTAENAPSEKHLAQSAGLNFDLWVERFVWEAVELEGLSVSGGQSAQGWTIGVQDEQVAGAISLFDDGRPIQLDLQYVRWAVPEGSGLAEPPVAQAIEQAAPVPVAEPVVGPVAEPIAEPVGEPAVFSGVFDTLNPTSLVAMDVSIDELLIGEDDYGFWSFKLRPSATEVELSEIHGRVRGVTVEARTATELGALLVWRKDVEGESTRFSGLLRGRNIEDIAKAWHLPAMIDSHSIDADVDFSWPGSPLMFSLESIEGSFGVKMRDGRFYRNTGQASNAMLRLVGLFNFDSWVRRLKLDFSDVYKGGTPYESIDGGVIFNAGMIYLVDPIDVKNTSSRMQMGGQINLKDETLDTSLVATLPVGGNATLITALAAGLPAAAGVYVVSKIFKKQMERVASISYEVEGSWDDPEVRFDKLFDNKAAKKASRTEPKVLLKSSPAPLDQ